MPLSGKILMIKKLVELLPPVNYAVTKYVCFFLHKITLNANVNKMGAR